jgi:hypothetical protein
MVDQALGLREIPRRYGFFSYHSARLDKYKTNFIGARLLLQGVSDAGKPA